MAARKRKTTEPQADTIADSSREATSLRNNDYLLNKVKYIFKEDGRVDWRKMISKDHIALNAFNYACRGKDVSTLSKEDYQKAVDEASEEDLVIKLGGFREIAEVRGFRSISSRIEGQSDGKVSVAVTIFWMPNFENPTGLEVTAIASASRENTDERFAKYLETIAENRAFVRAVRHSLGIIAVGQDEIKQEDVKVETRNIKLHSVLLELMSNLGFSMSDLQTIAAKEGLEWPDGWTSVEKIDPAAVITIIPLLKQLL